MNFFVISYCNQLFFLSIFLPLTSTIYFITNKIIFSELVQTTENNDNSKNGSQVVDEENEEGEDEKKRNGNGNENENGNGKNLNKAENAPDSNKYVSNLFALSSSMMKRAQESTVVQVQYLQVRSNRTIFYTPNS